MRVLVVQDDPNLRFLWCQFLETAGHDVLHVDTQPAALDFLQTDKCDLVVLDLCVQGRDALGVTTLATYRNPACKVVVVSGSSACSRKSLFAMSPAVAAALRKPVDIEDLVEVCATLSAPSRRAPTPMLQANGVEFRP